MIIPFTFLLGAVGYVYYKSKEEVFLIDDNQLDTPNVQIEDDDLYRYLEDLFI